MINSLVAVFHPTYPNLNRSKFQSRLVTYSNPMIIDSIYQETQLLKWMVFQILKVYKSLTLVVTCDHRRQVI